MCWKLGVNKFEVKHGRIATSLKTAELTTAASIDQEAYRKVEYLRCWPEQEGRLKHFEVIKGSNIGIGCSSGFFQLLSPESRHAHHGTT